jgi:hypothetical protein
MGHNLVHHRESCSCYLSFSTEAEFWWDTIWCLILNMENFFMVRNLVFSVEGESLPGNSLVLHTWYGELLLFIVLRWRRIFYGTQFSASYVIWLIQHFFDKTDASTVVFNIVLCYFILVFIVFLVFSIISFLYEVRVLQGYVESHSKWNIVSFEGLSKLVEYILYSSGVRLSIMPFKVERSIF